MVSMEQLKKEVLMEQLKKEVLEDMSKNSECAMKQGIRRIIDGILCEQGIIAAATIRLQEYQKVLRELELPKPISTNIFG